MTKVLIVDDDNVLLRMYAKKFELSGFEVATAMDGDEGLEKTAQFKPDVVLLDLVMPRVSGMVVLEKLKGDPATQSIPVILLTNVSSSEAQEHKGREKGALDYLVKSNYTPDEVVSRVRQLLHLEEPASAT